EIGRPEQFREVEPERPSRDQDTFEERERKLIASGSLELRLDPHRDETEENAQRKQRQEWEHVATRNPRTFPPQQQEQRHRQQTGGSLAQQRAQVQTERGE